MQQTIDNASGELTSLKEQQQHAASAETSSEDQLQKLKQDLVQAEQDAEALRATASANQALDNVTTEDGGKSVSEQLTERVGEIRAELEARYNERLAQLEETFKKRAENMKSQLTTKLAEAREKAKQAVAAEREQEMQKLRSEHLEELEKLRTRHRDELEELRKQEETKFAEFKEKWSSEHSKEQAGAPASATDGAADGAADGQHAKVLSDLSDAEARELIKTNNAIRTILKDNITKQVDKAKETLSAQLRGEHEKDLAEKLSEAQKKRIRQRNML